MLTCDSCRKRVHEGARYCCHCGAVIHPLSSGAAVPAGHDSSSVLHASGPAELQLFSRALGRRDLLHFAAGAATCWPLGLLTDRGLTSVRSLLMGSQSQSQPTVVGQVINVKEVGARGDGRSDDLPAIREWLAAIGGHGGTLYFPPGEYLVSDTIRLEHSRICLRGAGAGISAIIAKPGADFEYVIYGTDLENIAILDLTVDANYPQRLDALSGRTVGIALVSCSDSVIAGCLVKHACGYGGIGAGSHSAPGIAFASVRDRPGARNKVIGCTVMDCGTRDHLSDGIFTSGIQNLIVGCIAYRCSDTAFVVESSQQSGVIGCTAISCRAGGSISNGFDHDRGGNFINGLTVYDWDAPVTGGISISTPTYDRPGRLINTQISNVILHRVNGEGPAIRVFTHGPGSVRGLTLSNIRIVGAKTQGMVIDAEDVMISDCYVADTLDACIQLEPNARDVMITNNRLRPDGSFGIALNGCAGVIIQGNDISGDPARTAFGIFSTNEAKDILVLFNTIKHVTVAPVGGDASAGVGVLAPGLLGEGGIALGRAGRGTLYWQDGLLRIGGGIAVSDTFLHIGSTLGFYGAPPTEQPVVTGRRGDNEALASLLASLARLGLIKDQSEP